MNFHSTVFNRAREMHCTDLMRIISQNFWDDFCFVFLGIVVFFRFYRKIHEFALCDNDLKLRDFLEEIIGEKNAVKKFEKKIEEKLDEKIEEKNQKKGKF